MAREKTPEEQTTDNERKQLAEEKKKLKKEQQAQRKEAKRQGKRDRKAGRCFRRRERRQQPAYVRCNHIDRNSVDCCDLCSHQAGYRRIRKLRGDTYFKGCSGA